jgi:hypothetical protein
MPDQTRIVAPGPGPREVRSPDGRVLTVPADWVLVPPGDPGLTRRVKAAAPTWTVQEKRGRKLFSRGVWVRGDVVEPIRADLAAERADPAYAKKQAAAAARRDRDQADYVVEFRHAVKQYLRFHPRHAELEGKLAAAVADHATPVGSGTVARTERIPVEQRAEAAVIAWMRHQTTAYDNMVIPRVAGKRREVRRMLAQRSKVLLDAYRRDGQVDPATCPLQRALRA